MNDSVKEMKDKACCFQENAYNRQFPDSKLALTKEVNVMPIEFKIKWKNPAVTEYFIIRDPETKAEIDLAPITCELKLHCDGDGNNFVCIKFPLTAINFKSEG